MIGLDDYRKQLSKLKEMVQFGHGITFAGMMEQFREIGDEVRKVWPWVPFSVDGNLLCTIIPLPGDNYYELILVKIKAPVRFPGDSNLGFRLSGVEQQITCIHGKMTIEREIDNTVITDGETAFIKEGELTALCYDHGLFMFKQSPRVANTDEFSFDNLRSL